MYHPQPVKKAVITVAGLGTRFLPATKAVTKCLLPVLDKPVIQYIVEEMAGSGIKEIIFVAGPNYQPLKDHFRRDLALERTLRRAGKLDRIKPLNDLISKVKFNYAVQEKPLGNGHALLCARHLVGDESFAFSDGDSIIDSRVPAMKQVLSAYHEVVASVIGVQRIRDKKEMTKYGNVFVKNPVSRVPHPLTHNPDPVSRQTKLYLVDKLIEKPSIGNVSPQGLIVGGMRYVFTSEIWPVLRKIKPSRAGEIWLADAANNLAQEKEFYACEYEGVYYDTGTPEALLKTGIHFLEKRNRK